MRRRKNGKATELPCSWNRRKVPLRRQPRMQAMLSMTLHERFFHEVACRAGCNHVGTTARRTFTTARRTLSNVRDNNPPFRIPSPELSTPATPSNESHSSFLLSQSPLFTSLKPSILAQSASSRVPGSSSESRSIETTPTDKYHLAPPTPVASRSDIPRRTPIIDDTLDFPAQATRHPLW